MDPEPGIPTPKTNKNKNKKRFSDEQIKSLESMFGSESRPESQAKQQIASQLGLDPRQVAIWFQNRRARCKLKQVEHDYMILKGNYNNLATRFESLKDEHHFLISELQRLKGSEGRVEEANKATFATESFGHVGELEGGQGMDVGNMVETISGSPLSSGNGYSLESVLEPNYLAENKCWWESY